MPNEGPYGGKIDVRKDGSVVWQVAEREFARDRDTDGTLEYTIRVVHSDRALLTSRDGKCIISVDVEKSGLVDADKAKFLIVSGYETPDTPYESIVVGKSYFVTYGRYVPPAAIVVLQGSTDNQQQTPAKFISETPWDQLPDDPDQPSFCYDLSIRYDDYDLERAGLPADLDPEQLEVCYQNFVSLRDVYRVHFRSAPDLLQSLRGRQNVPQTARTEVADAFFMTDASLQSTLIWSKTYRHLEKLGVKSSLLDDIGPLLRSTGQEPHHQADGAGSKPVLDVLFSRWLPVTRVVTADSPKSGQSIEKPKETENKSSPNPIEISAADLAAAQGGPLDTVNAIKQEPEQSIEKPKDAEKVKASPDPIEISAADLAAVQGRPLITVANIKAVPGSRTITLRDLTKPGTFVLMYHGEPNRYDQQRRAD